MGRLLTVASGVLTAAMGAVCTVANATTTLDVTRFGAVPDDGLDDRAAIQRALDEACVRLDEQPGDALEVVFPPGRYQLEKPAQPPPEVPWVILRLRCGGFALRGQVEDPAAAILHLADAQGDFEALLAGEIFTTDVSDLRIANLTFDGNGANNPVTDGDATFDDVLLNRRHGIRAYVGRNIVIENNRFIDWQTVNIVVLNGVDVANVVVQDNRFEGIGTLNRTVPDWDHSSVFTDTAGAQILRNTFTSVGVGAFGVRAAIETHGPRQFVFDNRVEAFTTGMNATGISALGGDTQRVSRNRFLRVSDGIRVWANEVPPNPPGEPTLRDCEISDNLITIDVDGWRATQDPFGQAPKGIELEARADGVIENLTLARNTIVYTNFANTVRPYDENAAGILLAPFAEPTLPIRGLAIEDNLILRAPATGIYIGSYLPQGATIRGNRLIDIGIGPPVINDGFRSAFLLFGEYQDVTLENNCVIARRAGDGSAPPLAQGIYAFDRSLGGNVARNNGLLAAAGADIEWFLEAPGIGEPWAVEPPLAGCPAGGR
ncbi:MAG: glycosyl hydrolase family 28-related protein [Pseudomonadota bacterium]